ncbi:MAG: hypothetical protein WD075_00830 [Rhodospirillales bacterium]
MRVLCVIEDPGAANGMVGLEVALAELDIRLDLYATGAALTYAPGIGLTVHDITALPDPLPAGCALLVGTSENPDSVSFDLIKAAKAARIPSFGFVDGPANARHRFRGRTTSALAHAPDTLLVSDAAAGDAFIALGMSENKVLCVGHPHMDRVRDRKAQLDREGRAAVRARLFGGIAADTRLCLFAAETSDGLDPAEFRRSDAYTLSGRGQSNGRTEICLEEVIDALGTIPAPSSLVVRLHPKNTPETFAPYMDDIAGLSRGGDPLEAVYAADLVIGMTSVLLFEAAVMGRPTLSVTPRASERDWLSSIGPGLTRHVCTRPELRDTLQAALAGDDWTGPDRTAEIDALVPPGAAARMARAIASRIKIQVRG